MKKPHSYKTLSARKCKCGKYIKANVVARKPEVQQSRLQCYKCYKAARRRKQQY